MHPTNRAADAAANTPADNASPDLAAYCEPVGFVPSFLLHWLQCRFCLLDLRARSAAQHKQREPDYSSRVNTLSDRRCCRGQGSDCSAHAFARHWTNYIRSCARNELDSQSWKFRLYVLAALCDWSDTCDDNGQMMANNQIVRHNTFFTCCSINTITNFKTDENHTNLAPCAVKYEYSAY